MMHELPTFLGIYPLPTALKTAQLQGFESG